MRIKLSAFIRLTVFLYSDISLDGRNYLESGAYIEVFFPQHHVRYIAVNDGVDSEQSGGLDITPFKNILNEFYSRDISKKVKSGKRIRALEEKFMGTTAPFGYRKDPHDKNHLVVDEATAPTVRLIYSLALEGYGTNRIGKVLYERKIPKPSYYKQEFFSQHDTGGEDYRNKLMEKGVPPEEIAFIHEANTEQRKAELFGKVRSGQVRFLLGSTQKMGAGTNVQDRLIALHHLDVPWRPAEEGRAGRNIRKYGKIKAFRYSVTARSILVCELP